MELSSQTRNVLKTKAGYRMPSEPESSVHLPRLLRYNTYSHFQLYIKIGLKWYYITAFSVARSDRSVERSPSPVSALKLKTLFSSPSSLLATSWLLLGDVIETQKSVPTLTPVYVYFQEHLVVVMFCVVLQLMVMPTQNSIEQNFIQG